MAATPAAPFLLSVSLAEPLLVDADYASGLPALRALGRLELDPRVTFLVGENGSGKSTLLEAIAVASKLNPEGGGRTQQFRFATRQSHSQLHRRLVLERAALPPRNAFFLRAESVYNLATAIEAGDAMHDVFAQPLHEQSHGESFIDIAVNRFGPRGLYLLDEPEAALSVAGQLALLARMHELVKQHSQLVVATHSPILTGYPEATIYELGDWGARRVAWEETPQVELTRSFLEDPQRFLRHLFT